MNPNTGEIFRIQAESQEGLAEIVGKAGLVAITEEEATAMLPRTRDQRKNWMRNKLCPCQSGKKFKRCCWSKF